ncbi:MAG: sugar phosphate nucleotidyltransferase [Candidatus Berkelbacteria bacterium]
MEKYAAIILAAGKGTRMGDVNGSPIPKVMFRLNEKPIIEYSVNCIKNAGINKVVLVVGYKREMVQEYFGDKVLYAVQEEQLGTGHAVSMAKDVLDGEAESLIVFGGDNPLIKPETVCSLINLYEKERPTIAMLSVVSDSLMDWAFGRIIRDENGEVDTIVEQKDCTDEQLKVKEGNPAFYIFDAAWLWGNITKLKTENVQHELYLTDMIHLAREQGKRIVAMPVSEENEALGINTQDQLKEAEEILNNRR